MSLEDEKRSMLERKRNLLMLIAQHLSELGLHNTVAILRTECGLLATSQRDYILCDNVDLESIYLDYMSYNQLRFGRPPRILKRSESSSGSASAAVAPAQRRQQFQQRSTQALRTEVDSAKERLAAKEAGLSETLMVSQLSGESSATKEEDATLTIVRKPALRDHPHFSLPEWATMAATICRDTVDGRQLAADSWERLIGNEAAKQRLVESVITPLQYAQLYAASGLGRPWKCLLLYGPPGTGKTSLARALCQRTAERVTFLNVAASTMMSKWRGESEKMVRVLFEVAEHLAPSVVFLDEVEGVMSRRDQVGEHEATKRFKNELLTQLDGLDERREVFVLGCTNLPWDLDAAFLRRFERKILLQLPSDTERSLIIRQLIAGASDWPPPVWERLQMATGGFSGDDIRIAHKEAALRVLRQAIHSQATANSQPAFVAINSNKAIPSISPEDLLLAIGNTKPNSASLMPKYQQWAAQHGCE